MPALVMSDWAGWRNVFGRGSNRKTDCTEVALRLGHWMALGAGSNRLLGGHSSAHKDEAIQEIRLPNKQLTRSHRLPYTFRILLEYLSIEVNDNYFLQHCTHLPNEIFFNGRACAH